MKSFVFSLVLTLFACSFVTTPIMAGEPMEEIQTQVNNILDILRDPALKESDKTAEKEEKIKAIASNMFDYYELSRRTLGKNWEKLNQDQQQEFTDLFSVLLLNIYMKKILQYSDEQVLFPKVVMESDQKAEVQSNIVSASKTIPVYYRTILKEGLWKAYDVIIEGVSLVKNYRSQFKEIMAKDGPEKLFEILRKKTSEK